MGIIEQLLTEINEKYTPMRDGQIVQANGDGGDTLNRIGVFYSCLGVLGYKDRRPFRRALVYNSVGLPNGRYRRCPHPSPRWFNNPDNVTRDQMITVEAAWVIMDMKREAREHYALRAKQFMLHFSSQNDGEDAGPLIHKRRDIPSPTELAMAVRGGRYWALIWLLPILDLGLLVDVLFFRRLKDNVWDFDAKLIPCVAACVVRWPTPISIFAKWCYSFTDAAVKVLNYFAEGPEDWRNGIEPMGRLMALTFKAFIQGKR